MANGHMTRCSTSLITGVVQSLSHVQLFVTPWTAARQDSLSFVVSWNLLKFMFAESVRPSNRLILCHPLLLPPIFLSIRVFSNELALHIRWPKDWSFSISPSNEYSGLISFWRDWLDLLAGRGTLKSLKATVRSLQLVRMAIVKETGNNKCWRGCGEKGGLVFCCWECTLGQPLGKTVWRFLKI